MRKIIILILLTLMSIGLTVPLAATAYLPPDQNLDYLKHPTDSFVNHKKPRVLPLDLDMWDVRSNQNFYSNYEVVKPDRDRMIGLESMFSRELSFNYDGSGIGIDETSSGEILIDGNDDLKQFPGDGTEESPYVISGYEIVSDKDILSIQNTDAFVIVTNNYFSGKGSGENTGIILANVTNIEISGNTIKQTGIGIFVYKSSNVVISNNNISENYVFGILVIESTIGWITSNIITLNKEGIGFGLTTEFSVEGNTINYNDDNGVTFVESDYNEVLHNVIEWNGIDGVFFRDSDNNVVAGNSLDENGFYSDECARGCGPNIQVTHYDGEFPGEFHNAFTAEGRIGDSATGDYKRTFELDISKSTAGPFAEGETSNYVWRDGITVPFKIYYDIKYSTVSLTVNGTTVYHATKVPLSDLNDILLRTRATNPDWTSRISNVVLNFEHAFDFVLESSADAGDPNTIEINTDGALWEGLHLTGDVMLYWCNSETLPSNSQLAFQISFGTVLSGESLESMKQQEINSGSFDLDAAFGGSGIFLDPSFDNIIANNSASGNAGAGIYLLQSNNTKIETNYVSNNLIYGIFLENSSSNTVAGNTVTYNGGQNKGEFGLDAAFGGAGIFLDPSFDNVIKNNYVSNNELGIYLFESDRTEISNNVLNYNSLFGLFLENSDSNLITANDVTNNGGQSSGVLGLDAAFGGAGIFLDPSFDNILDDNYIYGNDLGIYLFESNGTEITNNIITRNGVYGLFLEDSSSNSIVGNTVTSNGAQSTGEIGLDAAFGGAGIFLDPSVDNLVENNYIADNDVGLHLLESDRTEIAGNTISSNDFYGLFLENSDGNSIIGNEVTNNGGSGTERLGLDAAFGGAGIFLDPSVDNTVEDNYIANNDLGLYLLETDRTEIAGNTIDSNAIYGLLLNSSDENRIVGNIVTNNGATSDIGEGLNLDAAFGGAGIFLDPSVDNIVENNYIANSDVGLHLLETDYTEISDNIIESNGFYGLFLDNSDNNRIVENEIRNNGASLNNEGGVSLDAAFGGAGIFLDPSFDNVLLGNIVTNNRGDGLYSENSENTVIEGNEFADNDYYGVNLDIDTASTKVSKNNFLNNGIERTNSQARDDNAQKTNSFNRNFFNDADLTDEDGDGIADNPYLLDGEAENSDENPVIKAYIIGAVEVELTINPHKIVINPSKNPYFIVATLPEGYFVETVDLESMYLNDTVQPVEVKIGLFDEDGDQIDNNDDGTDVMYNQFRLKFEGDDIMDWLYELYGDENINEIAGSSFNITLILTGEINDGLQIFGDVEAEVFVLKNVRRFLDRLPVSNISMVLTIFSIVALVRVYRFRKDKSA